LIGQKGENIYRRLRKNTGGPNCNGIPPPTPPTPPNAGKTWPPRLAPLAAPKEPSPAWPVNPAAWPELPKAELTAELTTESTAVGEAVCPPALASPLIPLIMLGPYWYASRRSGGINK